MEQGNSIVACHIISSPVVLYLGKLYAFVLDLINQNQRCP